MKRYYSKLWLILLSLLVLVITLCYLFLFPQQPFQYREKAYTAQYEFNYEDKIYSFTISSDGKGHKRWDANSLAPEYGINNYLEGKHYEPAPSPGIKTIYWRQFKLNDIGLDEEYVKAGPWAGPIGERIIAGRLCRGWDIRAKMPKKQPGNLSQRWYDKETGCLAAEIEGGNWWIRLISLNNKPMPKEAFEIPKNCTVLRDPR